MYQKCIIIGNLGGDPQERKTPDGTSVTSFSVATNKRWTDGSGEQQERTVWWRVTTWRRLAETCAKYLRVGRQVYVEGELREPEPYKSRDGEWRASLDLTAYTVKFLGARDDTAPSAGASAPETSADAWGDSGEDVPF